MRKALATAVAARGHHRRHDGRECRAHRPRRCRGRRRRDQRDHRGTLVLGDQAIRPEQLGRRVLAPDPLARRPRAVLLRPDHRAAGVGSSSAAAARAGASGTTASGRHRRCGTRRRARTRSHPRRCRPRRSTACSTAVAWTGWPTASASDEPRTPPVPPGRKSAGRSVTSGRGRGRSAAVSGSTSITFDSTVYPISSQVWNSGTDARCHRERRRRAACPPTPDSSHNLPRRVSPTEARSRAPTTPPPTSGSTRTRARRCPSPRSTSDRCSPRPTCRTRRSPMRVLPASTVRPMIDHRPEQMPAGVTGVLKVDDIKAEPGHAGPRDGPGRSDHVRRREVPERTSSRAAATPCSASSRRSTWTPAPGCRGFRPVVDGAVWDLVGHPARPPDRRWQLHEHRRRPRYVGTRRTRPRHRLRRPLVARARHSAVLLVRPSVCSVPRARRGLDLRRGWVQEDRGRQPDGLAHHGRPRRAGASSATVGRTEPGSPWSTAASSTSASARPGTARTSRARSRW